MSASATIKNKLKTWQAGAAVMALGVGLLGAGLLVTTSAAPPADCPAGSTLVSKYKINNGAYTFEKPAGNQNVVTLSNTTAASGNWSSTVPIVYMIVKAGPDSITTSFAPPLSSGSFDNLGFTVGSGNHPNLSDVLFCQSDTPATTTTVQPTTTTKATTTTTLPPTTSTSKPTTTTTTWQSTTTTTQPATTSTVHASGSTSTVQPTTTTTVQPTTTTTTLPPTTTTLPLSEGTTTTVAPTTTTGGSAVTSTTSASTTTVASGAASTTTTSSSQTGSNSAVVTSTSIGKSSPSSGSLPRTGGQSMPLVVTGLTFLVAGLAMTLLALKRRRTA